MPGFLVGLVIGAVAMSAYSKKKGGASLMSSLPSLSSLGVGGKSYRETAASGGRVDEFSSAAQSPIRSENVSSVNAGDGTPSGSSSAGTGSSASSGSGSSTLGQPLTGGTGSGLGGQSPAAGLSESRH
ncbi:hypothetical protein [Azohydromonas aeria]|uniref:hypothetical protein n=1 Tax=Azohydromonas aeria TaxID=2590212 RepID=UPI0012FAF788|nr:hypothetical protein [Azohydromonas aeria]